jgi:DNA-binding transcriptional MerR regulator
MLDYFALGLLIFVALVLFYGIIALHDIPYLIAKARNHPHQDAIHVTGWVSLFTLHAIWPFLWIWATLYKPDRGWGMRGGPVVEQIKEAQATRQEQHEELLKALQARLDALDQREDQMAALRARIESLEQRLQASKGA